MRLCRKYREGGGNFSVPLQWMLGLRRLKLDAIWLELLPATEDPQAASGRRQPREAEDVGERRSGRGYVATAPTREESRHGRLIVRDQDAAITRGDGENVLILQTSQTC